jgi:hypothetical protein
MLDELMPHDVGKSMDHRAALDFVVDAIHRVGGTEEHGLIWLGQMVVVARGLYAPDHFEYMKALEEPQLVAAWDELDVTPGRELLYMYGMGGHPGGSWAEIVSAHVLDEGTCVFAWQTDVADAGQQGTFLFAHSERENDEVDMRVVERALSGDGLELARGAFSGTLDEMRTALPRDRLVSSLVEALDGEAAEFNEELWGLGDEAPDELERGGRQWKTWLVESYFAHVLPK